MKANHIATAAALSALLWSCTNNKEKSQPEPQTGTPSGTQEREPATPQPGPAPGTGMMQQWRAACPMVIEGADVTVSDTEGGVALTFTADEAELTDLRQRVRHLARMYEMHRGHGSMMWHHMGRHGMGGGRHGMGMGHMPGHGPMPGASTRLTDIEGGVRLELTPTDPSQLEALREQVRWHQQRMHAGECWMLQDQPPTGSPGEQP